MGQFNYKQQEAWVRLFDNRTRFIFFGGGAGGGKSWLACEFLITCCELYPETRWLMGRNVLKYLKETTLNTFFKVASNHQIKEGKHYTYNSQSGLIRWHNGSEIVLRELKYNPADPLFQDLGSLELTGAIVDEAPEISFKAFDTLKTRVGRQHNDKYNLYPKILLTGNPVRNWVFDQFIKQQQPGYAFIQSLAEHNREFLPPVYFEVLDSITDRVTKQRLRDGNWNYDDDPGILVQYAKINDLWSNDVPGGEKYITCDVARKGRDKSIICLWDGWRCTEITQFATNTIPELADAIRRIKARNGVPMSNIIADEDGVGGGLIDILQCNGFVNNSRPIEQPTEQTKKENFDNLRSQCIFKLCQQINNNAVHINVSTPDIKEAIEAEISAVRRKDAVNDGKVSIISREEFIRQINRSPDYLSALMQRVWFDIAKRNYKPAKFNFL